ncbi:CDP-alcohol phosphatidyltransferase family protein [bacterium]|nr:CDP-alcohol phosphatidyltransferase family protein [bacterium]
MSDWKSRARDRMRPVILTLDRWGFTPLAVSITGLAITLLSAYIVAKGNLIVGAIVFLIGSAFDMLDGGLARLQGTTSARGAFLDSVLDRFGEAAFLCGVAVWFMNRLPNYWDIAVLLILITLFGSLATSYVRARAEGVGETCYVGVLQRTERVILLGLGALLGRMVLFGVLWILAVGTVVTVVQRIVHVANKLPGPEGGGPSYEGPFSSEPGNPSRTGTTRDPDGPEEPE